MAEALSDNNVATLNEDKIETVVENINTLSHQSFLKGVSSKFIRVAENLNSRTTQSVNVSNLENYQKFTLDNFVIVNKNMTWAKGTDREETSVMTTYYNSQNGILSLGKQKSVVNVDPWTFWNTYDVYVFNE